MLTPAKNVSFANDFKFNAMFNNQCPCLAS